MIRHDCVGPVGLLAFRLGYVDNYIAGQVKDTSRNTASVRDQKLSQHRPPQRVEMLGVELRRENRDKLAIDQFLARFESRSYALNLRRNINLKDLQIDSLEL
jgi:hypothetical protein